MQQTKIAPRDRLILPLDFPDVASAEAMVDRPVIQTGVAVRESVRAGQDGDDADRVQGCFRVRGFMRSSPGDRESG